jgi:anti-anti-sigma regulatory factor
MNGFAVLARSTHSVVPNPFVRHAGGCMTAPALRQLPPYRVELAPVIDGSERRALRAEVLAALERGHQQVVIDCRLWNSLDLGVLSALIQCAKVCDQRLASFEMVNVGREISLAIDALRLAGRLGLHP